MKRFIITASLLPFVFASSGTMAKPKSQCNMLQDKAQCEALTVASVALCQWIDMSQSYTANGQRKSYCRTSGKSITKEQFEAMQTARQAGSSN